MDWNRRSHVQKLNRKQKYFLQWALFSLLLIFLVTYLIY
jgi:hypothetical protein